MSILYIRQMVRRYVSSYQFYIGDGVVRVVQPLPQSLLLLVWDFGQLNTQVLYPTDG